MKLLLKEKMLHAIAGIYAKVPRDFFCREICCISRAFAGLIPVMEAMTPVSFNDAVRKSFDFFEVNDNRLSVPFDNVDFF